jgi:hypothetical protein
MRTIPRWCANCKHGGFEDAAQLVAGALLVCKHPLVNRAYAKYLADGEYRLASAARNDSTACSLEGRLWEPKVELDTSMRPRADSDFKKPRLFERLRRIFSP